jgi:hypothetical protein
MLAAGHDDLPVCPSIETCLSIYRAYRRTSINAICCAVLLSGRPCQGSRQSHPSPWKPAVPQNMSQTDDACTRHRSSPGATRNKEELDLSLVACR